MVFYDEETQSRPLNLGFVTPSVTTFTGMDPSYTIYTVDGPGEGASYVSARCAMYADGMKKKKISDIIRSVFEAVSLFLLITTTNQ